MSEPDLDLEAIEARLEDGDYLPQPHWAEEDVEELIAEVKRLRQDRAEVRRDALLEGARAMCEDCKDKDMPLEFIDGQWQHHIIGEYGEYAGKDFGYISCDANAIHQLLAADQGQGKD